MAEIKIDLESGHYDETLLKYKPRKLGANPTEISAVEQININDGIAKENSL
jgi:hypothetical protein